MEVADIARAINGPWFPVPEGSKYSLLELRAVRWDMATRAERGEALNAALAVHREIGNAVIVRDALFAALELVAASGKFECFDDGAWDVVNNALSLARCSSQVEQPQ